MGGQSNRMIIKVAKHSWCEHMAFRVFCFATDWWRRAERERVYLSWVVGVSVPAGG